MKTLSPITKEPDTGRYHFTLDDVQYWTNHQGQGLWTFTTAGHDMQTREPVLEPQQILGTEQIDLNPNNRRARVLDWAIRTDPEASIAYQSFLDEEKLTDSYRAVTLFARHYNN